MIRVWTLFILHSLKWVNLHMKLSSSMPSYHIYLFFYFLFIWFMQLQHIHLKEVSNVFFFIFRSVIQMESIFQLLMNVVNWMRVNASKLKNISSLFNINFLNYTFLIFKTFFTRNNFKLLLLLVVVFVWNIIIVIVVYNSIWPLIVKSALSQV